LNKYETNCAYLMATTRVVGLDSICTNCGTFIYFEFCTHYTF